MIAETLAAELMRSYHEGTRDGVRAAATALRSIEMHVAADLLDEMAADVQAQFLSDAPARYPSNEESAE